MPPTPAPVTVAHAPVAAPAAPPPPPTPAGPPVVTMPAYMYMVGDLGLAAQQAAGLKKRAKKTAADIAEMPAVTPLPEEKQPARRRRKAKASMLGRGYEYMDLDQELTVTASDRDAGPLGFAGSAARAAAAEPGGLATLTKDRFDGNSTTPMLPSTWNPDQT
jgi:PPE-repeat protein